MENDTMMSSNQPDETYSRSKTVSPKAVASSEKLIMGRPTATLLLAVIVASFGTWFPLGYNIVSMNGPQTVIVQWIRHVRCNRIIAASPSNTSSQLWCGENVGEMHHEKDDGAAILGANPELNTLWAIASSISGFGGLVSTFFCALLVNHFGPKRALFATAGVTALGKDARPCRNIVVEII